MFKYILCSFSYAGEVLLGGEVLVQGNDDLTPAMVTNVSSLMMQGSH